MAKRIEEFSIGGKNKEGLIIPKSARKLNKGMLFYDGLKCEEKTYYKAGTLIGDMQLRHQKNVTNKDVK